MNIKQLNQSNDISTSLIASLYEAMPYIDEKFHHTASTLLQLRYELPRQAIESTTEVAQLEDMLASLLDKMYEDMSSPSLEIAVLVNTLRHVLDTY